MYRVFEAPGTNRSKAVAYSDVARGKDDKRGRRAIVFEPQVIRPTDLQNGKISTQNRMGDVSICRGPIHGMKNISGQGVREPTIQGFWYRRVFINLNYASRGYALKWLEYFFMHAEQRRANLEHPGVMLALKEIYHTIGWKDYMDGVDFWIHTEGIRKTALSVVGLYGCEGVYNNVGFDRDEFEWEAPPEEYKEQYFKDDWGAMPEGGTDYPHESELFELKKFATALVRRSYKVGAGWWALTQIEKMFCSKTPEGVAQSFISMPVSVIKAWDDLAYVGPRSKKEPGATRGNYEAVEDFTRVFDLVGDLTNLSRTVITIAKSGEITRKSFLNGLTGIMSTLKNSFGFAGKSTCAGGGGLILGVVYGMLRGSDVIRCVDRLLSSRIVKDDFARDALQDLIVKRGLRSGISSIAGFTGGVAAMLGIAGVTGPIAPILITLAAACGLGLLINRIMRYFSKDSSALRKRDIAILMVDYMEELYETEEDYELNETLKACKVDQWFRGGAKRARYIKRYLEPAHDMRGDHEEIDRRRQEFINKIESKIGTWQ